MKKVPCYIVCDLLPLYIDNACSEQTAKDIEEHILSCKDCEKLYRDMTSNLGSVLHTPEFESQKIFHHARKSILGIIVALAVMISCFSINAGSAWEGGPAEIGNFAVTMLYVIFWSIFSCTSRKYEPLVKVSFVLSLITFVSSFAGVVARVSDSGGFVTALLSIFSSIPFYGFRFFTDWTGAYAISMILSLCWFIYTWYAKRKLKHIFSENL